MSRGTRLISCLFLLVAALSAVQLAHAQIKRIETPLRDAIPRALAAISLTGPDGVPFHISIRVNESGNSDSPYQGTIEEWWASSTQWRREVTAKGGMHQTIVVANGSKTERDDGDYFPLWMENFVTAAFDPLPHAEMWTAQGGSMVQIVMPNGDHSDPCARAKSRIGDGTSATEAFYQVCFDQAGLLKFVGGIGYSMEFANYRPFGRKRFPHNFGIDPEPGTRLSGEVTLLEKWNPDRLPALFAPLEQKDTRFRTVEVSARQMQHLLAENPPIVWPTVRSGNTEGTLALYVSADKDGRIREAWPLNSANAGLNDSAREQVRKWKGKPAVEAGQPVQVNGPITLAFSTKIADAIPNLSDAEVRALAVQVIEPKWPAGTPSGQVAQLEVSVNEKGERTGEGKFEMPQNLLGPVLQALEQWRFRPLVHDGKAQYFHATVRFVAP